jgi:hypothetical protein
MRRASKLLTTVLIGTVAIAVLPTTISASEKSDQKLADNAVLRSADVPASFEEVQDADETSPDDIDTAGPCGGEIAEADKVALSAPHARSDFALIQAQAYAIIGSEVAVLDGVADAKTVLDAYQDEDLAEVCVQALFEAVVAQPGVTTEVSTSAFAPELDDKGNEKVIKGGSEYAGYSASLRQFAEGGEPQFYEAVLIVGRVGRAILRIRAISLGTVPIDDMQEMTQVMVRRLKQAR